MRRYTKVYKPASPQSYCTCGFRHDEFLAGDFDLHAERPDAVCQASSVPGPDSCVKGPCGAHPNKKVREATRSSFSASADAVYRLPQVAINMVGSCQKLLQMFFNTFVNPRLLS